MAQYCRSCGATLEDGAQFCRVCGATQAAPLQQPAQPVQQQSYQAPYAAPQPVPQYAPQPSYYAGPAAQDTRPLTVGDYIVMMLVSGIPLIGFIMILVWAFGSQTNLNKKNYARAMLIMMVIGIVLYILFAAALFPVFRSLVNEMQGYTY